MTTGPHDDRRSRGLIRSRRASSRKYHQPDAAGFTLLELVLVMVVICTVLAMAAPSLRGFFASRQTADAAAQIVALTRLARSQAVAEGRIYRLNLDEEAGTYWLTVQEGGTFVNLGSEFGRLFSLPDGTLANWEASPEAGSRGYIQFHPDGRNDTATVRLTGRRGQTVDISCHSPTELFHVATPGETRNW